MQIRQLLAIPMEIYSDKVFNFSYIRFLEKQKMESIKLPSNFGSYKYQHLLRPNYLLSFEVVKTRKNWVITSIHKYWQITSLDSYNDFLSYTQFIKYLTENLKEGQPNKLLDFLLDNLENRPFSSIDIEKLKSGVQQKLGFE